MHHLSLLTTKRKRPLKRCEGATLLRKCFVGRSIFFYRNVHPQVTNLSFADTKGLDYLDFFNKEPRITTFDYKMNPSLFKVWMDLLKELPDSVLSLMKLNKGAHTNLTESAHDHGVDPERINFASRLQRVEDHLDRYRLVDLFIDTFPCNGHTTAGDSLRAGLPVVCLCGGSFASRVVASLLHDVGMPELAFYSFQEYHDKALQMETDEAIGGITKSCCRFESIKSFGHLHQPHKPMP